MTIKLAVSARLRVAGHSRFSFSASDIETYYDNVYFILGFKRTTGAPVTIADLNEHMAFRFFEADRGTFTGAPPAPSAATGAFLDLTHDASFIGALAGDHVYFLVVDGGGSPPDGSSTFIATKSLGPLAA